MNIFILYLLITLSIAQNNQNSIQFTFNNTNKLLTISGNGILKQIDNNLYNLYKEETKETIIQNGISEIENGVFYNWNTLNKITISSTIKSIGKYCFANCEKLETVQFEGNSQLEIIKYEKEEMKYILYWVKNDKL